MIAPVQCRIADHRDGDAPHPRSRRFKTGNRLRRAAAILAAAMLARSAPAGGIHGLGRVKRNPFPGLPMLPGASALLPPARPGAGLAVSPALLGQFRGPQAAIPALPVAKATAFTTAPAGGNEIVSDGSLGSAPVTYSNGTYRIPSAVGTLMGGNLFESFSLFGLSSGEIADFENSPGVQNILARVTGGSASSINGTLQSETQGANLFLINPAGVIFGPNASLNVSGAFTVSTADYVKFSDGGMFSSHLGASETLSTAPVSAFGFTSTAPAPVSFTGSQLSVPVGTGINVVAGNITLDSASGDPSTSGAMLSAPGGALTLFSAASDGEVPFDLNGPGAGYSSTTVAAFGTVILNDISSIGIDSLQGGGSIIVRAGNLTVENNSLISAANSGPSNGGTVSVSLAGSLTLVDGGEMLSSTFGSGRGGDVTVQANTILISGFNLSETGVGGIFAESQSDSAGANAGAVNVTATGALTMEGGGKISTSTSGPGNGGDITVKAGSVVISTPYCGILADSTFSGTGGHAGSIDVLAEGKLTLESGGEISSSTFGLGKGGGDVRISAGSILISGVGGGVLADAGSKGVGGDAGSVDITARGQLTIEDSGQISSSTFFLGIAGNVTVTAKSILISAGGIYADSISMSAGGNAGSVDVTATEQLTIENSGFISSSTYGLGNGGNVIVKAGTILITGARPGSTFPSEIFAASKSHGVGGQAGSVDVTALDQLMIEDGGMISSSTYGNGPGGQITVRAQDLTISGISPVGMLSGGINAASFGGTGSAGAISVQCDNLTLDSRAQISTASQASNAGDITIDAESNVTLSQGSSISVAAANGNGGSITVRSPDQLALYDSQISAEAGLNGGNVTLYPGLLILDPSSISANAINGQGGQLVINIPAYAVLGDANDFLIVSQFVTQSPGSLISASSQAGVPGTLRTGASLLDLSGQLIAFNTQILDVKEQLEESCATALRGDVSSFVLDGAGGISADPGELQPEAAPGGERKQKTTVK